MSEQAIDQRLRRMCTNGKKKKKASGGDHAVEMYKDLLKRDEMAKMMIESNFSPAAHMNLKNDRV